MRVLDGVVGSEVRGGVFPNQALGRRLSGGHRKLVDSIINGGFRDQGEGALDDVGLAIWSLFSHVDGESVISVVCGVEICWGDHDGHCAKDGFPCAGVHPGMQSCGCGWVGRVGGIVTVARPRRESARRRLPFLSRTFIPSSVV